jgi:hypothetical protein
MDQQQSANPVTISNLPEDALLVILKFLGLEAKIIGSIRLVNSAFKTTIDRLFDNKLNTIQSRIKEISKKSEEAFHEGRFKNSDEIKLLELAQSIDVIKKLPAVLPAKINEIIDLYVGHIRAMLTSAASMSADNKPLDEKEFSKKEIISLCIQNAISIGCFHLLWEKEKDSKFNETLKKIIQDHFNDIGHDPAIGVKKLQITDFRNADLSGIYIGINVLDKLINLAEARFEGANLENADLSGAYNIPLEELTKAKCLIGLRGLSGETNNSNVDKPGAFKKLDKPFWKGVLPDREQKDKLQKEMAKQYQDRISSSNNIEGILYDLHRLVIKSGSIQSWVYLKTPIDDMNFNIFKTTGDYYQSVLEAGRKKLLELVKTGAINIADENKVGVKAQLEIIFYENFEKEKFTLWKTTPQCRIELQSVIEALKLTEVPSRRIFEYRIY